MRFFVIIPLLLLSAPAWSQRISVAFKAGVPFDGSRYSLGTGYAAYQDHGRWTLGPAVELQIWRDLSIEASALYRQSRSGFSDTFNFAGQMNGQLFFMSETRSHAWDFPVLLKYRIGTKAIRPILGAGYSWTRESNEVNSTQFCVGNCDPGNSYAVAGQSTYTQVRHGPAASVGAEIRIRRYKITPELRYTRLNRPADNRFTILVGFGF